MKVNAGGGSPAINPQRYQTTPLAVISQVEQQDRFPKQSELNRLAKYFDSGAKLLEIAATINQNSEEIVAVGAKRIFYGGNPLDYLEKPKDMVNLPGYVKPVTITEVAIAKDRVDKNKYKIKNLQRSPSLLGGGTFNFIELIAETIHRMQVSGQEPLPGGFKTINISRYGEKRMKRSMRDLDWFLRYITFAIVADDPSILVVNARGLRGVIPEDVTVATVVALKEMCWKTLSYFTEDDSAKDTIKYYFDVLIQEYEAEKPANKLREGVSNDQQGLELPQSYWLAAESRPKYVMKLNSSTVEKQAVIKAAYRQVFESDIKRAYSIAFPELESQVLSGNISVKGFIRSLGRSRLYRRLFYEPYTISRAIELAFRHFLGRGISSLEEFQDYFEIISRGGLPALINTLVDSVEYADYFGEETVPYLRGLGQEAQECRNWGAQLNLFKHSTVVRKVPQFVTLFGNYQQPLPNQHPYGVGNDVLETQFGAVFKSETHNPYAQPAPFTKDHRRLLINSDSSSQNVTNSYGSEVALKLGRRDHIQGQNNINLARHSIEALIRGAYHQVLGHEPYSGQHLTVAETKLKNGELSVQEFVRHLGKSKLFRSLYWDKLYITKAISAIHRRILGRPTQGRAEMNHYYDLCSKKGFYALIDAMVDSDEYSEVFGEDTVPYERYLTPKGWEKRSLPQQINWTQAQLDRQATAGEVVAQKIRADRDRQTQLASDNGNRLPQEKPEVVVQTITITETVPSEVENNSHPLEPKPSEKVEESQEQVNYEYSPTVDS